MHTIFRIWKKIKMVESNIQGVEIDTPEDLQRAKTILRSNN